MGKTIDLNADIDVLGLSKSLSKKIKNNEVNTVFELWKMTRGKLKEDIGLTDQEIYQIKVKLQLESLDLNGKIYRS